MTTTTTWGVKKLFCIEELLREALRVMVEEQGQEVERLNLLFLLLLLSKRDTDKKNMRNEIR